MKNLTNIKEMRSAAFQGGGYVLVEFNAGADLSTALEDVRDKVADAKRDLPQGADEPTVNEVNLSEFPVLVVTLSGEVPERSLTMAARELRDRIEEVPGVLEAALQGVREDLVEVIIDPVRLSSYGLQLDQLIQAVGASNSLVAAGTSGGLGGPLRGQGAGADRDTPRTSPICRSSPARMRWCGPATWPPSVRPSRTPRRSPGWTASRRSPSRSRSAPAPI